MKCFCSALLLTYHFPSVVLYKGSQNLPPIIEDMSRLEIGRESGVKKRGGKISDSNVNGKYSNKVMIRMSCYILNWIHILPLYFSYKPKKQETKDDAAA